MIKIPQVPALDIFMQAIISLGVGYKYGIAIGFFAFAVQHTLDQIFWLLAGRYIEVKK